MSDATWLPLPKSPLWEFWGQQTASVVFWCASKVQNAHNSQACS